jgi:hypothetical protein
MSLSKATSKIKVSNQLHDENAGELNTAQDYVDYFVSKGYSRELAAGIVGSLQQESNLSPTAINPSSKAYGIAQWLGSRKAELKQYVAEHGGVADKKTQLDFIIYELNNKEKAANKALKKAKTASEAAVIWSEKFERPGKAEANNTRRAANAESLLAGNNWKIGEDRKADKFDTIQLAKSNVKGIEKSAAAIGAVSIASKGSIAQPIKSVASAIYNKITGKISSKSADVATSESENPEEEKTSLTVQKPKKKIAYETAGLNSWQKKVIVLLTDWANSKRIVKQENKYDTISINQALNEKDETETIQLPKEEKSSFAKSIANVAIGATAIIAIPAIANIVKPQLKGLNPSSINIDKPEKPKEIKINVLPKKEALTNTSIVTPKQLVQGNVTKAVNNSIATPKQPVKEKITKAVNSTVEKLNKPVIKNNTQQINTALNRQVVQKVIPKQIESKKAKRQIIINNTVENEVAQNKPTTYLFGDRYEARQELKQLWIEGKDIGHGLRHRLA